MKALVAMLAAFMLSAPSEGTRQYYAGPPPERFMGDNAAFVLFTSDPDKACGGPVPGYTILGCYRKLGKNDLIILPNPCILSGKEAYATLACHELAHRNKWAGDHPI